MSMLKELPEELIQLAKTIIKVFKNFLEMVKDTTVKLARSVQAVRKDKPTAKVIYKPVLKLLPFKKWLRDKRLSINYCRNNC